MKRLITLLLPLTSIMRVSHAQERASSVKAVVDTSVDFGELGITKKGLTGVIVNAGFDASQIRVTKVSGSKVTFMTTKAYKKTLKSYAEITPFDVPIFGVPVTIKSIDITEGKAIKQEPEKSEPSTEKEETPSGETEKTEENKPFIEPWKEEAVLTGDWTYYDDLSRNEVKAASKFADTYVKQVYGQDTSAELTEYGRIKFRGPKDSLYAIQSNIQTGIRPIKICRTCLPLYVTIRSPLQSNGQTLATAYDAPIAPVACFAGDTTVQTRMGQKNMSQLQQGDEVLTMKSIDGKVVQAYEPIRWFVHRKPCQDAEFISVTTTSGKNMKLTHEHLLPIVPCDLKLDQLSYTELFDMYSVFARRLRVGSCVLVQADNDNRSLMIEKVSSVSKVTQSGIFAPITKSGAIIAGGIHASCYTSIESQRIARHAFDIMGPVMDASLWLQNLMKGFAGTNLELPWILSLFMDSISSISVFL